MDVVAAHEASERVSVDEALQRVSIVQIHGSHTHNCGYCHSKSKTSTSFGITATRLTCQDYVALLDHGWRRSGTYLYKQDNRVTCCPALTIRLDTHKFSPSKSQLKLLRRFHTHMCESAGTEGKAAASGADGSTPAGAAAAAASGRVAGARARASGGSRAAGSDVEPVLLALHTVIVCALTHLAARAPDVLPPQLVDEVVASGQPLVARMPKAIQARAGTIDGHVPAFSSDVCVRVCGRARAHAHTSEPLHVELERLQEAVVAQLQSDVADRATDDGRIHVAGGARGFVSFALPDGGICRAAASEHESAHAAGRWVSAAATATETVKPSDRKGASPPVLTPTGAATKRARSVSPVTKDTGSAAKHRDIKVVMVPAAFDAEAHALYQKYQMAVHGDKRSDCDREQYTRFLCSSPLLRERFGAPVARDPLRAVAQPFPISDEKYKDQLPLLLALGVTRQKALEALEAADGEITEAMEIATGEGRGAARSWSDAAPKRLEQALAASADAWIRGEGSGEGLPLTCGGEVVPRPADLMYCGASTPGNPTEHIEMVDSRHSTASAPGHPTEPTASAAGSTCSGHVLSAAASAARSTAQTLPDSLQASVDAVTDLQTHGYGAFHQRYYLDGKLVAVGVVDVLPHCLSSVYVFYDPALPHLELGKLTALREIMWVRDASRVSPRLKYYYMGFYIHSCQKMRYKGEYRPSDIMCPVTRNWVPLADAVSKLDKKKYVKLDDSVPDDVAARRKVEEAAACAALLASTPILLKTLLASGLYVVKQLNEMGRKLVIDMLREWMPLAGAPVASRTVLLL